MVGIDHLISIVDAAIFDLKALSLLADFILSFGVEIIRAVAFV